ncbi:hypothetical protein C5S39_07065 [Candidatus Methanophagaceae archaeon]|nr:hypothetical protein C5S39_07065 [Methanophagales archaeon]
MISIKQVQFLGSYLEKCTLKNSSRVIAINKKLAEFVTAFGAAKEKTSVIGAGIDLARYNPELDGHEIREVYGLFKKNLLPAYPDETIMHDIVPIKMYEYMAKVC